MTHLVDRIDSACEVLQQARSRLTEAALLERGGLKPEWAENS